MRVFYVKGGRPTSLIPADQRKVGHLSVQGHRKRVREEVLKKGTFGFAEHHLVEYVLFHGIPRKDTRDLAYDLVNRYGNLYGISCAPYEELIRMKGMTEVAAVFLTSLGEIATRFLRESGEMEKLRGVEELLMFLRKVIDPRMEACYVLTMSSTNEILSVERVLEGVDNALDIPLRLIARRALDASARRVIVVHNHPSGTITASHRDRLHTYKIDSLFKTLKIDIIDHIIIYEQEAYSVKNDKFYRHNWRFR